MNPESNTLQYASTDPQPHWRRWPIVELLVLAAPTVAQMSSYTLMQFTDRWMLGRIGGTEGTLQAAAAGTAGITFFAVIGFGFGVLLVVNTLVSQSFGRNDLTAAGRYLWQGIWFAVVFGLATLLLYPRAEELFRWMGHAPQMAKYEADYFRVVALVGSLKLITTAMSQALLGLHRPMIVLVGTILGIVANVLFNWLLIYGNWGFPRMGVAGAAWGTNAAVLCELLVMAAYIFRPSFARVYHTFNAAIDRAMMARLLRVGLPAGVQLICDIVAWTVFMNIIIARFGTAALTANSFAFSYMHVCFMPAIGVGAAVTALVGKYIGMGRHDLAERRAHLGFFVCATYMVLAGATLFFLRYPLIGLFTDDPETLRLGAQLMLFVALYQIFDAMFVIYVGALRGAGDTLVPAVVQTLLVWTIVVGGGFLTAGYAPQYGINGPWILTIFFGACLGLFFLSRFVRGGWKSIRLHDDDADGAGGADSRRLNESDRVSNLQLTAES
jgi:MATE family multidrug resistance protein